MPLVIEQPYIVSGLEKFQNGLALQILLGLEVHVAVVLEVRDGLDFKLGEMLQTGLVFGYSVLQPFLNGLSYNYENYLHTLQKYKVGGYS